MSNSLLSNSLQSNIQSPLHSNSSTLTSSALGSPKRRRGKKRRGSGSSNASIISIDQLSLDRLRRQHDRATKASRKRKEAYKQQKRSQFEMASRTYANELKEGQSDDDNSALNGAIYKLSGRTEDEYVNYDSGSSKEQRGVDNNNTSGSMEDITVEELMKNVRTLVDYNQELQENYERIELEYTNTEKSLKMALQDEIQSLRQQHANLPLSPDVFSFNLDANANQLLADLMALYKDIERAMNESFREQISNAEQYYENNLLQSQYQHDIDNEDAESMNKKVEELNKEIDDLLKENDHLRQSLEQVQDSLRVTINEKNKQWHGIQRLKKVQKQLSLENDSLQKQNTQLQRDIEVLVQEQEQREDLIAAQSNAVIDRRSSAGSGHLLSREQTVHIGGDRRPQTPTHHFTRTVMTGNTNISSAVISNNNSDRENGSNRGLSDHDSSLGGNDLMHQIGDQYNIGDGMVGGIDHDQYDSNTPDANHRPKSSRQSSSDPPDRGSNYGDDAAPPSDEVKHNENGPTPPLDIDALNVTDDEKKKEEEVIPGQSQSERRSLSPHHPMNMNMNQGMSAVAQLARFKNIGDAVSSLNQIQALLQDKEVKRLQPTGHSQPSQEVLDNYSVESNYSESEQKLEEHIDNLEDEIRELKVVVEQLMHSTNRITPQITHSLIPLKRKINHMYLMLSTGPMESHTAVIDEEASMAGLGGMGGRSGRGRYSHRAIGDRHSQYDSESEWNETSSQHSNRTKSTVATGYWVGWITPWLHDWMPSVGFSAILLSTMYLMFKYQNGGSIYGKPKVLRTGRH